LIQENEIFFLNYFRVLRTIRFVCSKYGIKMALIGVKRLLLYYTGQIFEKDLFILRLWLVTSGYNDLNFRVFEVGKGGMLGRVLRRKLGGFMLSVEKVNLTLYRLQFLSCFLEDLRLQW